MDEQSQFRDLLRVAQPFLPASVVATCDRLNENAEWELALGHCRFYLHEAGDTVPKAVLELAAACDARFKSPADA